MALILAVERGMQDIIDILVERGADVNVKSEKYVLPVSEY